MATVEFDPEDYLDEISTETLKKTLIRRGVIGTPARLYTKRDLIEAIKLGDQTHLNIVIEGLPIND